MDWLTAGSLLGATLLAALLWWETSKRRKAEVELTDRHAELALANARLATTIEDLVRARHLIAEKEEKIRELESHLPPADRFDSMFGSSPDSDQG